MVKYLKTNIYYNQMNSSEIEWTEVSYKKIASSKQSKKRVGKYIPPSMKKVDYNLVQKNQPSLKSKSEN